MHLMVDIETMGRNSHAPVIEIAVVCFDHLNVYDRFHSYVMPDFGVSAPEPATLAWWVEQEVDMPLRVDAPDFHDVIRKLGGWVRSIEVEGVWANAPSFDLVILHNLAQVSGTEMPWDHKLYRDFRTIRKCHAGLGVERVDPTVKHDAVADAEAQAWTIININNALTEKGVKIL